jgi:hypothetical protein
MPFVSSSKPVIEKTRIVPFDFGYASATSDEVELLLPEGYAVTEPPATASAQTSTVLFQTNYVVNGESLKVTRQFETREVQAPQKDAPGLAAYFDDVVSADQQQLVAKRRPARGR